MDTVAHEVVTHYRATDIVTVLTGVDQTLSFPRPNKHELREQFGVPRDAFVGMFVARWDLDKAVDVLEQVMKRTPGVFWV